MLKRPILIFLAICMLISSAYIVRIYFELKDGLDKIINYKPILTTQIIDRKDRLIANVFDGEFRFYAKYDEIPPKMVEALLAVEDTLFFEHNGINFDAIFRAMVKNIKSGKYIEGGSTLTQQLVKNIALTRDKTISRKIKEAILSIQVEHKLSKEQLLERYFNQTFFGHGYYGVKAASQGYFKKPLKSLTLKEIAMLMSLPRAPSFYDPTRNIDFSLSRANNILERMLNIGWIGKSEYDKSIAQIPEVYDQSLGQNLAPYVVDEALRNLSHIPDIKTGGYTIKLNIDLDYQKIAQNAVIFGYQNLKSRIKKRNGTSKTPIEEDEEDTLNGAMIVTENKSGKILALVGGIDHEKSAFNRATQSKRQFGSSVKPFIYQVAFDSGYSTATSIPDVARSFNRKYSDFEKHSRRQLESDQGSTDTQIYEQAQNLDNEENQEEEFWRPKNYSQSFSGLVTLKEALKRSLNLATINLVENIGFDKVYSEMQRFGFNNIPKDMSIILGSFGISPLEAAKEYSIFSNYGTLIKPILIDEIISVDGKVTKISGYEEYITENEQAYLVLDTLKDAVKNGTGRRARVRGLEVAGKTGTSNNNVDAWFCGFSPSLQAIIWFGRDDNTPIGKYESGGVVSPPVFAYFFKNLLKIEPGIKRKFDIPNNVYKKTIDGVEYSYTKTSDPEETKRIDNIDENLIF